MRLLRHSLFARATLAPRVARHGHRLANRRLLNGQAPTRRHDPALWFSIATLALLGTVYGIDPAYHREHHATTVGEQRSVSLPDGTRITLAPETQLDVGLHLRTRRATLHRGHAWFAVAPAAYGPFDVRAGATSLRVAPRVNSARFDVRRDGDELALNVAEGQFEVDARQ